jgi:citrate synthase
MSVNRSTTLVDVPRGLAGVVVTDTEVGDVRGREGFYHYRQYSAVELAQTRAFEDVWHLLVHGELPDAGRAEDFRAETAALRRLPDGVRAALPAIAAASGRSGPLAGMRTALSLLGAAKEFRPVYDIDPDERRRDTLVAAAAVPTLLTALHRLGKGLEPVEPREDLSYAANYLYMLTGWEPEPQGARAVEQYLISTIDHGFNASTFTARVIASTGADAAACLVGAVGALSGPLHGGAPSRALDTLDAIGTPDRIDSWIRERVLSGERIMGFGHAIYRTEDPRSRMLREGPTVRRSPRGLRCRGGTPGRGDPGRAQARAGAAHQRRVLRGRGHGTVRSAPRDVHADVRGGAGGGMERQHPGAGGGLEDHQAGGAVCGAGGAGGGAGGGMSLALDRLRVRHAQLRLSG